MTSAIVGWLSNKKTEARDAWNRSWSTYKKWEYGQCNDDAVWDHESDKESIRAAARLAKEDPEAGFRQMLALAEQGSVWAMVRVAYDYQVGAGIAVDFNQAEQWYRRACQGGSQRALLYYGWLLYRQGDLERTAEVFQAGVVDDWAPAMYWFCRCKLKLSNTRQTFLEVLPLLERGSAKGNEACERIVAIRLTKGQAGLRRIAEGMTRLMAMLRKQYEASEAELHPDAQPNPDTPPGGATLH